MRGAPISSCPVHIAGRGTLVVQVVRVGEKSFLKQVARHIEEARALKPGIIQLVDKTLKYYVPGVWKLKPI